MKKTLVDIVLPVYNGSNYLKDCIQSVLNQTYNDFNLLILDDCSEDNSLEIIKSFKDDRIIVYRNEKNKGLFYNLNFLIEKSNSDFIHLWSQDDIMYTDCIDTCVKYYKQYKFKMAYSAVDYIDADNNLIHNKALDNTPTIINRDLFIAISVFYGSIAGNIANVCISKEIFNKVGKFDERFKVSADFEYWVRIGLENDIIFIQEKLIKLRKHKGQLSRQNISAVQFMEEDSIIFTRLYQSINNSKNLIIAKKYASWKRYTNYLNTSIMLLLNSNYKLFIKSLRIINQNEFIVLVFVKWILIRFLRLIKQNTIIYNRLINKYHV